jgi:hypothetical protein
MEMISTLLFLRTFRYQSAQSSWVCECTFNKSACAKIVSEEGKVIPRAALLADRAEF